MLLTAIETAALLALLMGIVAALSDYLRGSTLFLIIKLAWQGSIKLKGLSWSPLKVTEADIVQRPESGGDTVFKSEHVVLDSSLWRVITGHAFEVVVGQSFLDWTSDEHGDSQIVKLLHDVGYVREVKAKEQPERLPEPKGWQDSDATKAEEEVVTRSWEADVRAYTARLLLRKGTMHTSKDIGMVLGEHLRVKALVGASSLEADARETGPSTSTADPWFKRERWPPPSDVTGRPKYPVAAAAASENLAFELAGWRTTTGLLLHRPLRATLHFTPAIADHLLAKLSPVLGAAVGLEAGDSFSATLTPLQMHLPAECYSLRLEPLKLVLAARGLLSSVIALLNKGSNPSGARLEAWTSALEAELYKDGRVLSKRLDLIVGPDARGGKGVHLCAWGRMDAGRGSAMDMTLGLPAASLRPLGLGDLPADYVFPIPVRGTSAKPQVDLIRAGKQLAELALKHRVSQGLPFMRGLFDKHQQHVAATAPAADVPPAQRPFPWESDTPGV